MEIVSKFINLGSTGKIFHNQVDFDCNVDSEDDRESYFLDVYVFFISGFRD